MNASILVDILKYYGAPMVSNAMPVFVGKGTPIDKNIVWIDNRRLLGNGKTWEGLATGILGGFLASLAIGLYLNNTVFFIKSFIASITGLLGDIVESFVKRRLGIKRGDPLPILDQLDFAIGATIAYAILGEGEVLNPTFLASAYTLIMVLHVTTNTIAYLLKIKDRPW